MLRYGKAISAEWIKQGKEGKPGRKGTVTFQLWAFKASTERTLMVFFFLDSKCQRSIFPIKTLDIGERHTHAMLFTATG